MPRSPGWLLVLAALVPASASEPVDLQMVTRIRDEGFQRSQVLDSASMLTDVIGPRLTASPAARRAHEWAREQFESWGLGQARLEAYDFGQGWSFSRCSVHMLGPQETPLIALPKAWSPGTGKPVRGEAVRAKLGSEEDFEKHRGELHGKIVFLGKPAEIEPEEEPPFERYGEEQLDELVEFPIPTKRDDSRRERGLKRHKLRAALHEFLAEEGVLATVEPSSRAYGLVRLGGTGVYDPQDDPGVTALVMAAEQYNRIVRLLEDDLAVELEIDVRARFHTDDLQAYNTLAEIPGGDKAEEIVMVGAHLDSWHPGTGASDNAAGSAVAMEAVRILTALEVQPRRTIRIALWSGEEQGLRGSRAYVERYIATRPLPESPEERKMPAYLRKERWPITVKEGHATHSVYFNLDNGSGRVRGIYAERNAAVRPIFEAWLQPFHDLGADTVTLRRTYATDHSSFDRVGVPGFQFIQDRLDYSSRTHHSNMDVFDHLQPDDLKQAAVVLASFLYHAAMRDEMLPRAPMPRKPPDEDEKDKDSERSEAPESTSR